MLWKYEGNVTFAFNRGTGPPDDSGRLITTLPVDGTCTQAASCIRPTPSIYPRLVKHLNRSAIIPSVLANENKEQASFCSPKKSFIKCLVLDPPTLGSIGRPLPMHHFVELLATILLATYHLVFWLPDCGTQSIWSHHQVKCSNGHCPTGCTIPSIPLTCIYFIRMIDCSSKTKFT